MISIINKLAIVFFVFLISIKIEAFWPRGPEFTDTIAPMVDKVLPAVVTISVEGKQVAGHLLPEPFRHFFGEGVIEKPFKGVGSGVVWDDKNGYIITNYHVIKDADNIFISTYDGRELKAKLIGVDSDSDVALLHVNDKKIHRLPIANSDNIRVGDFVVAIGNPFGIGQTVTSGIISALGRSVLKDSNYENFIQTDASINSGNSGGALVNFKGELIGINTAILAPNGGNIGIGFAIPINMVKNIVAQIIQYGEVKRASLGILGSDISNDMLKIFNLPSKHGTYVSEVLLDSPAYKAGLKSGDIIIAIDQKKIKSFQELRAIIATKGVGSKVELSLLRDKQKLDVVAVLGETQQKNIAENIHVDFEGARFSNYSENEQLGVLITEVNKGSIAYRNGLKVGDVIILIEQIGVGKNKIQGIDDLKKYLKDYDHAFAITILREGIKVKLIFH